MTLTDARYGSKKELVARLTGKVGSSTKTTDAASASGNRSVRMDSVG